MKTLILFLILSLNLNFSYSQNTYSLEQCIDIALKNNFDIQQRKLGVEVSEVTTIQSKATLLPDLNVFSTHGINRGRSIDPFTNTYVNQEVKYSVHSLSSSLILFNGLSVQNNIKDNVYNLNASKFDLQQQKDVVAINVMLAYMQVLNNQDQIKLAQSTFDVTAQQVERLEKLNKSGAISPPQLHELKGQLMDDEIAVISAQASLETSKLALSQLLNIPYDVSMTLEEVNVDDITIINELNARNVYENALKQMPVIKAAEFRSKSREAKVRAIRGELFPVVRLNGNVNTNYSSAAIRDFQEIPYRDQLENNIFSNINIGINIPLFNASKTRTKLRLAQLELSDIKLQEENTKMQLRQEVEQATLNVVNAAKRLNILERQALEYEEAFRAAEVRFNAGIGSSVDYLVVKNNFDRIKINLLNAKYDLFLRNKIFNYFYTTKFYILE